MQHGRGRTSGSRLFAIGQSAVAGALIVAASGLAPAFAQGRGASIAGHGTAQGAPACISCHGTQGEGNAASGYPRLAGLPVAYLRAQLRAFATGQRKNPLMAPIAKLLQPDEAQAVTAYFAGLPLSKAATGAPASGPGAALAREGRWSAQIPACVDCHGPGGIGVGTRFPPLAGQPALYLEAQLKAWRQGTRPPGPLGLMQAVARRLKPADIPAVAQWFAALPPGGAR